MDDQDDDMIVIAEAERDVLLVLLDIDSSTNISDEVIRSDEEGDNGSISKHGGVVTRPSTNFDRGDIGSEELFDNEDDVEAEGR